jgi:NDP-sugar pyrophosphorylase family protein
MNAPPQPFKAMIMAAGLGTRLYPLTGLTAKPMVPILNRPVMEHILNLLARHGVREVAANLYHYPDEIRSRFGDGSRFGLALRYKQEKELLGTAGGVGTFREFFAGGTFVVVSGDALTDVDLSAFVAYHKSTGGLATLVVKRVSDPSLYGVVVHDEQQRVTGFQEKPARDDALSNLCNCGIYAFEPGIFDFIPSGVFTDFARDVFPAMLAAGAGFHVWPLGSYWNDVGNIEQYRLGNFDALLGRVDVVVPGEERSPGVWVGKGTQIAASAVIKPPVLIGTDCRVEGDATLVGPLIVGDGCVIEAGAVLEGVIHWNGVRTGRRAQALGGILGHDVYIQHHAIVHEGAVIGDQCQVAAHSIVGPQARLEPCTTVDTEDLEPS